MPSFIKIKEKKNSLIKNKYYFNLKNIKKTKYDKSFNKTYVTLNWSYDALQLRINLSLKNKLDFFFLI